MQKAINSKSYEYARNLLDSKVDIIDSCVWGKWLCLILSASDGRGAPIRFMVKNNL